MRSSRLQSLITLILLLVVSALLAWASTRQSWIFDWTRSGRHTLSEASIRLLQDINGPVSIVSYAREQTRLRLAIEHFVERFRRIKPDIDLQFRNPDAFPDEVRELGVGINGEMVIRYSGRTEHVKEADENTFMNALLRLADGNEKWIAFIEGHGERNPVGKANHDLGEFGKLLGERGFRIRPLNLAEMDTVPDNTSLLILAGPQIPLLEGEVKSLLAWLQGGGNFLWLTDPDDKGIPSELAAYLGVNPRPGTVIDVGGQLIGIQDATITLLTGSLYGQHSLLIDFSLTTLFPRAGALIASGDDWTITPLLTTATHTWLETGTLDANSQYDNGVDTQGPLTLGLVLERTQQNKSQKVAVIADGDFISNRFVANAGNMDLGLRLINWLGDNGDQLQLPARMTTDTQLTASPVLIGGIGIVFLLVLPVGFSLTGLFLWWRRKHS